jgi:hypothetical protein
MKSSSWKGGLNMPTKFERREFIKRAAYAAPVILSLKAMPAFAAAGSGKHKTHSEGASREESSSVFGGKRSGGDSSREFGGERSGGDFSENNESRRHNRH